MLHSGRLRHRLAVAVSRIQQVERFDEIVPAAPDQTKVVPRTGDIENADVRRFVATDEERFGDADWVQRLHGQVEQGGVLHQVRPRGPIAVLSLGLSKGCGHG